MEKFELRNEFAYVSVELDEGANGQRLKICDLRTGRVGYLDPLELESLAWSTHEDLEMILDPSHRRWAGTGDVEDDGDGPEKDEGSASPAPGGEGSGDGVGG